jgi:hypothetical protein
VDVSYDIRLNQAKEQLMRLIGFLIILSIFICASCSSEPRFDGSNMEVFQASQTVIESNLAGEDLVRFKAAFVVVTLQVQFESSEDPASALMELLDGKSASDLLKLAMKIPDHNG